MKTHFFTLYLFKQNLLRAPSAPIVRHFPANFQGGGGGGGGGSRRKGSGAGEPPVGQGGYSKERTRTLPSLSPCVELQDDGAVAAGEGEHEEGSSASEAEVADDQAEPETIEDIENHVQPNLLRVHATLIASLVMKIHSAGAAAGVCVASTRRCPCRS